MRLIKIGVKKFRKFTTSAIIDVSAAPNILIGSNNGGKSSFCDAIRIFFGRAEAPSRFIARRTRREHRNYNYTQDYPASINKKGRVWPTVFFAVFKIKDELKSLLNSEFGISIKNEIEIQKTWNIKKRAFEFSIKGLKIEPVKINEICNRVISQFRLVYIPAVRDSEHLNAVFRELFEGVARERIESSKKIKKAISEIENKLAPEIKKMEKSLDEMLKKFIAEDVTFNLDWNFQIQRSVYLENIMFNNSISTPLELQGDGLKSLSLLALSIELAKNTQSEKKPQQLIFVIEEPEAHLNSAYLHVLKKAIQELSEKAIVFVTTHSPVFVNFYDSKANHLFVGESIKSQPNRQEIASALGVRLFENLHSKENCIIVEGQEDLAFLNSFIPKELGKDFIDRFDIKPAVGAGNLPSSMVLLDNIYKNVYVLVDNDKSGNSALDKIRDIGLDEKNIFKIPLKDGNSESELEDLVSDDSMSEILSKILNRTIDVQQIKSLKRERKGKWSTWMRELLNRHGSPVSDPSALKGAIWDNHNLIKYDQYYSTFLEQLKRVLSMS